MHVHITVGLPVGFLAAGEELVFPDIPRRGAGLRGVRRNVARLVLGDAGVQGVRFFPLCGGG